MGYTTDFEGRFDLNRTLDPVTFLFLKQLNVTRRMKRRGLAPEYGVDGEFFVGGGGFMGQNHEDSIADFNAPPSTQPSLWCQWVPTDDGNAIEWDGGEKFYEYVAWLEYLIEKILEPRGYVLNGSVKWAGEDPRDLGVIDVRDNRVSTRAGRVIYEGKAG